MYNFSNQLTINTVITITGSRKITKTAIIVTTATRTMETATETLGQPTTSIRMPIEILPTTKIVIQEVEEAMTATQQVKQGATRGK